jgi:hypothetical protein
LADREGKHWRLMADLRVWAALSLSVALVATATSTEVIASQHTPRSPMPAAGVGTGNANGQARTERPDVRDQRAGVAEAKLIEAYKLIGEGRSRDALRVVDALLSEYPNFRLAALLHGDLLAARTRPVTKFADVPDAIGTTRAKDLEAFKAEAISRINALREPPPAGRVPKEFLRLPPTTRHAIAVDASRSRLYLFENGSQGIRLVAHYYASLGLAGTAKQVEGDQRTPLGVYFITSNLNPKSLGDLYGSGALPINYPNELDKQRGRTGSGIWLHGMPSDTFARPLNATDGCVALANPDLERLLTTVGVGTTPVLITPKLEWVEPNALAGRQREFDLVIESWRQARVSANEADLQGFYAPGFRTGGKDRGQFARDLPAQESPARNQPTRMSASSRKHPPQGKTDTAESNVSDFQIRNLSVLSWFDQEQHMIVTFNEVTKGARMAPLRRQYWQRDPSAPKGWRIYFEGVIG